MAAKRKNTPSQKARFAQSAMRAIDASELDGTATEKQKRTIGARAQKNAERARRLRAQWERKLIQAARRLAALDAEVRRYERLGAKK